MRKSICVFAAMAVLALSAVAQDREKELARIEAASNVIREIQAAPDKGIPAEIMGSAECVAVIPSMLKGGFVVGGQYGKGIATCRHGEQWSAPAPIRVEGGSWGLQIGGQAIDLIMLVMNDKGMNQLLQSKFKVGADVSAAAGPVGRHVEGTTDWKMRAQVLTYSRARGAFAGITLNGAVLKQDEDDTVALYGRMVPFPQILSGSVPAPAGTQTFLADVSQYFRAAQTGTVAGAPTTSAPAQPAATSPGATAPAAATTAVGSATSATAPAASTAPTGAAAPPSSTVGASAPAPVTPAAPATTSTPSTPAVTAGTAGAATGSTATLPPAPTGAAGTVAGSATAPATGATSPVPGTSTPGTAQPAAAPPNSAQPGAAPAPASAGPSEITPADVKSSIEKALRDTPGLSSGGVIINVTQTSVELTGSVPSAADKQNVRRIAEQNAGGRKVDDTWLVVK